jgi:hypothetical protein
VSKETPKGKKQKQPHQIKFKELRTTTSSLNNSPTTSHHTRRPNPIKINQRKSKRSKVNKIRGLKQSKNKKQDTHHPKGLGKNT